MCLNFSVLSHLVGSFDASRAERLIHCIGEDFPIGKWVLSLINGARTGKTANVVVASGRDDNSAQSLSRLASE